MLQLGIRKGEELNVIVLYQLVEIPTLDILYMDSYGAGWFITHLMAS